MRAISPLIAAVLLLGFTVAVGAIVIQWGKTYTQQQLACLRLTNAFDILSYSFQQNQIVLSTYYKSPVATNYGDIVVKLHTPTAVYVCKYQQGATTAPSGGCVFDVQTTAGVTQFQQGNDYTIKVLVDPNTININTITEVELYSPDCEMALARIIR